MLTAASNSLGLFRRVVDHELVNTPSPYFLCEQTDGAEIVGRAHLSHFLLYVLCWQPKALLIDVETQLAGTTDIRQYGVSA